MNNHKSLITFTDVRYLLNSYLIGIIFTFAIDRIFGYLTNEDYNYNYIKFIGFLFFFILLLSCYGKDKIKIKPRRKFVNALSSVQRVPRK